MRNDNYMPCEAYEGQAAHPEHSNFVAFKDAKTNEFYFAMVNAKGKVVLKSEGYPIEKSRETGLRSVLKNCVKENFFSVKEEAGVFFVSLRAGNYKEIARSCDFKTEKKAKALIASLFAVKAAPKAKKATATKATKKTAAKKTTKKTVAKKTTKKTATKTTTKKPAAKKATSKKTVAPAFEVKKTYVEGTKIAPAYADVNLYMGHATLYDEYGPTGYAKFAEADRHFFVVYNPDRSIYLRSEAFDSEAQRDAKFAALQQNIVNPEQYEVREVTDHFAVALLDDKKNEIARSAEFASFTEAFRSTPKGRVRNEGVNLY